MPDSFGMPTDAEIAEIVRRSDDFRHYWLRDSDRTLCCGQPIFLPRGGGVVRVSLSADLERVDCPYAYAVQEAAR